MSRGATAACARAAERRVCSSVSAKPAGPFPNGRRLQYVPAALVARIPHPGKPILIIAATEPVGVSKTVEALIAAG